MVGKSVSVELPGGWHRGTVMEVLPQYAWTGEDWARVEGRDPVPFITATRVSALVFYETHDKEAQ